MAMVGLPLEDVAKVISREMHIWRRHGRRCKPKTLPIDENYVCSLEDGEISEYVLEALRFHPERHQGRLARGVPS